MFMLAIFVDLHAKERRTVHVMSERSGGIKRAASRMTKESTG